MENVDFMTYYIIRTNDYETHYENISSTCYFILDYLSPISSSTLFELAPVHNSSRSSGFIFIENLPEDEFILLTLHGANIRKCPTDIADMICYPGVFALTQAAFRYITQTEYYNT